VATRPEQDLPQLETLLRQLEKEYEQFFSGILRREPTGTESQVLGIIRAYAGRPLSNPTLGFKYNSLVARYNSFRTVWTRKMREREEGRGLPGAPRPVTVPKPEPRHTARSAANPAEYLSANPLHEQRHLEQFFETYRRLREETGESTAKLQVESFQKALAEKVEKIKKEQGCDAVLIRVTKDQGRTRIVAKPFRRPGRQPGSPA
jgi:hypothetical protein